MPSSGLQAHIIDSTDCFGRRIVFSRINYDRHRKRHPELEIPDFCPRRIIEALKQPTFTIQGKIPLTQCFYLEEFKLNGVMRYTKVIVGDRTELFQDGACHVIYTAFRIDHVQEVKYGYTMEVPKL